jgi:hypothetical protein
MNPAQSSPKACLATFKSPDHPKSFPKEWFGASFLPKEYSYYGSESDPNPKNWERMFWDGALLGTFSRPNHKFWDLGFGTDFFCATEEMLVEHLHQMLQGISRYLLCEHVACTFCANVLALLTWKGNRERLGESQPLTRVATLDARNCFGTLGVCIVTTVFSAYSLEVLFRISFLSTAIVVHDATF